MISGKLYTVRVKIKPHTRPIRLIEYDKTGVFLKETSSCYVFNDFRVHKANVVNITRSDINEPK